MKIAFDPELTTPKAEKLIDLYADYVEGEIESAMHRYNKIIETCTLKDFIYMAYHTPFDRHRVELMKNILEVVPEDRIPHQLMEKYGNAKKYTERWEKSFEKVS